MSSTRLRRQLLPLAAVLCLGCTDDSAGLPEGGVDAFTAAETGTRDAPGPTPDARDDLTQDKADTVFPLNPKLAALNDDQALDLGPYACPSVVAGEPAGLCRHITDYSGLIYNRYSHQLMMFGGGHASTSLDDVVKFDFNTLKWTSSYTPTPCGQMTLANYDVDTASWIANKRPVSRHTYDHMVMHPTKNRFVVVGGRAMGSACVKFQSASRFKPGRSAISSFDPSSKAWSNRSFLKPWGGYAALELDPQSGLVIILDTLSLWAFDIDTLKVAGQKSHKLSNVGTDHTLVYFPPTDTFYSFKGHHGYGVFAIKVDRKDFAKSTVKRLGPPSGDKPPIPDDGYYVYYGGYAYDSRNNVIGGGVRSGAFYVFVPQQNRWEKRLIKLVGSSASVGDVAFHALAYDPVNNVYVFINKDFKAGPRTFAYRYRR